MSQTVTALPQLPLTPPPPRPARPPQTYETWKNQAFTALGWKSATEKQQTDHLEMRLRCVDIAKKAVRPLPAAESAALRKGAGSKFTAFIDLRATYENPGTRPEKTVDRQDAIAGLKSAANSYIGRYDGEGSKYRRDDINIRKRDLCVSTINELKQLEYADQINRLPPPPWTSQVAKKAAELKVRLDLASLPPGKRQADYFDSGTVSPTFWINKAVPPGSTEPAKTFLFKPATLSPSGGFPPNGEPAREALAGKVANFMNETMRMKLPVPNTQVMPLAKDDLPAQALKHLIAADMVKDQEEYIGSIQQFEDTDGSFADKCTLTDRAKLDTRSVQELAVFDLVTLNTDRHDGNFLVKKRPGQLDQLIPIDHGNCLPTARAISLGDTKIGTAFNALIGLPASHQPFLPEVQKMIDRMNPADLEATLRSEQAVLENQHPGIGSTVSDESIVMSKRSAMFLKLAAPILSPAAIQVALKQHAGELLDVDIQDAAFAQVAARVIIQAEADQDLLKQWFLMPGDMQQMVQDENEKKGWVRSRDNIILTLKLWNTQVPFLKPKSPAVSNGALTPQEEGNFAELRRQFPMTTVPKKLDNPTPEDNASVRRLLGLLKEWEDNQGTPAKINEYLQLCGETPDISVGPTYKDLEKAIDYLQLLPQIRAAMAAPPADPALVETNLSLAYIDKIIPALSETDRARAAKMVVDLRARIAPGAPLLTRVAKEKLRQDVESQRISVAEAGRTYLLGVVKGISAEFERNVAVTLDERELGFCRGEIGKCTMAARDYQLPLALEKIAAFRAHLAALP